MNPEEKIIIDQIRHRNREVYEMLFNEYYYRLCRFAERIMFDPDLAEDVVQNLFVHIWENAEVFEINSTIKSYLYQSVKNKCLNNLKSLQIRGKNSLIFLEFYLESEEIDDEASLEYSKELSQALNQLPPKMSEVMRLKYLEGKKHAEIADQLNVSENTIKTQLLRAKKKMRTILQDSFLIMAIFFR